MVDEDRVHGYMSEALGRVKGIVQVRVLSDEDRVKILAIEKDAEARSLLGLGKVVNTGVRRVLECELVYVALTNMEFDWGCHSSLLLKKGEEIVGREVRDPETIGDLSKRKDVWFMHRNFVVFKDKISFPEDIMKKLCFFEIPCLPAEWCTLEEGAPRCQPILYANPATPSDRYLKDAYFAGLDENGAGTILIGTAVAQGGP
ncbi:MAG: hypothetical protein HY900_11175 [Deltaproteobacteria bacterium]|nr:hypothetical protein [Deltaproteobacteria bacterium]